MKIKNKRVSSGKKKPVKWSIDVKGEWKAVDLDPSLFSEKGLDDLVCFEELKSYRLVDSKKAAAKAANVLKKNKAKKRKVEKSEEGVGTTDVESKEEENTSEPPKKKTKKNRKNKVAAKTSDDDKDSIKVEKPARKEVKESKAAKEETSKTADPSGSKQKGEATSKEKKKKLQQQTGMAVVTEEQNELKSSPEVEKSSQDKLAKPLKRKTKNWTNAALSSSADKNSDVSAWKDLFVPSPVLKALSSLGFSSPTPIQALALPPAIRDRMDILGAAETGSGKTLAFGIPMIHTILEWKDSTEKTVDDTEPASKVESLNLSSVNEPTKPVNQDSEENSGEDEGDVDQTQEASDGDDTEDKDEDEQLGCVKVIDNVVFDFEEKPAAGWNRPLLGLVLTPTRELAVQVKHHIDAVAKFTDIKTAVVVGVMAQQKQRRVLKRRPEIVIATPGRLWDLIQEQHPHLVNLRQLKCLVIDEADRMVERGHFAELESLLEMLNTTHSNPTRQMFVFSATLTMAHSLPTRLLQKKKSLDKRSKLEILMEKVGIKAKPKVLDLTRKEATVETLTETQIHCQKDEKDFYLYYFLVQHPGRTMVFANSIDCIKRLNSLLVILDCSPLPLHANMHQKHRLKNLERFAEKENCVLLTTDVAARGLDIPNIQHVIHYQVPRTSETYVHRSGRTARATKEGLSLLLIGPDDMMNFRKIYKTLGKEEEELPVFPIETKCMEAIKERVNLARSIEKIEYYNNREKQHDSWFRKAAEALEVDLDDDLLLGGSREEDEDREQQKMVKGMKKQLKRLISQPVFKGVMKTKYPTKMGKLPVTHMSGAGMESALTRVSVQKKSDKLKKSLQIKQKKQKKKKVKQQQ